MTASRRWRTLDLQPFPAAAFFVIAVAFFGDDAFQSLFVGNVEQGLAMLRIVVGVAERVAGRIQGFQFFLALFERDAAAAAARSRRGGDEGVVENGDVGVLDAAMSAGTRKPVRCCIRLKEARPSLMAPGLGPRPGGVHGAAPARAQRGRRRPHGGADVARDGVAVRARPGQHRPGGGAVGLLPLRRERAGLLAFRHPGAADPLHGRQHVPRRPVRAGRAGARMAADAGAGDAVPVDPAGADRHREGRLGPGEAAGALAVPWARWRSRAWSGDCSWPQVTASWWCRVVSPGWSTPYRAVLSSRIRTSAPTGRRSRWTWPAHCSWG